jgi:periplasmic divalent cation tolerance protein
MYYLVITTFENKSSAEKIAHLLIENKLAACVSLSKAESIYRWGGEKVHSKEIKMEIKTNKKNYNQLKKYLLDNHEFETPQIIKLSIADGATDYFNWIDESLSN